MYKQFSQPAVERTIELVRGGVVANRLGVGVRVLHRLIRSGKLPAVQAEGGWYYVASDAKLPDHLCKRCGASLAGFTACRNYCERCQIEHRREVDKIRNQKRRVAAKRQK